MEMSHLTEHGNFIPEFHSERACLKNGYSSAQAKQFDFEPRLYVLRPCVTLLLMYIFFFFFFPFPQLPSRWKSLQHKERSAWETRNSSSVKVRVIWKMPYETQLDANVTSYNNTGGFNWDHFIEVIQVKLWHSWTLITSSALKKSNAKDKTVLKKRRTDEDR